MLNSAGQSAMALTDIFIKRPVLSVVVSLLILLIGLRAATVLPIRQYPKLSNTVVNVTTSYPGASADLIQGFITTPIEQAVASAEGVDYMTSSSVQGTSTIQGYIKLNFDPNQALTEVLAKVNSVKYLIPKESNDPVVTKTTGQTTAVMYLGFSSEVLSGSAISDYLTRVVQPVLSTVDGVASADILGGQTFAMRLWLDPVRMAGRNVSADDVNAAIRTNNFQAAAGQAKGYFVVSNVTTNTDLKNLDQFKRMIVKSKDGGFVRLEDIATVELAAQSTDASVAFNGEHAIFIGVQATPQGNPLTLVKGVRALFPELERNLPPSMKMKVAYDSTKFIQSSIDEVEKTLGESIIIVVVVIFLFLASFRSVIIPVVTIPLSLVGVCSLMLMMGFSINLLTLLAMVLGIGHALVWPPARSFARLSSDHGVVRADHPRSRWLPLPAHLEGTRARRRSGHRVRRDQGAEIRQHRLFGLLRREARQGILQLPGNRSSLRPQWHQRPAKRNRRHVAQCVGRAGAIFDQAETAGASATRQDRRRQCFCVQPAALARRPRRIAGADGDQFNQRISVGL